MQMQRPNDKFDAADRKVYAAWLRKISIVYGVVILIGTVVLTVHATKPTANVATSTAAAVAPLPVSSKSFGRLLIGDVRFPSKPSYSLGH